MTIKDSSQIVSSIDIGTTKICVLVARIFSDDSMKLIGVGESRSVGLQKGIVADIAQTASSIKSAVTLAESMSGVTITSACIGVSGSHIRTLNSSVKVSLLKKKVHQSDIDYLFESVRGSLLHPGEQILHLLPRYFQIDKGEKIDNPLNMHGTELELCAHVIIGNSFSVSNVITSCRIAGIQVTDIVLEQLASACAVLSKDECELGVGIVDIGGGTSDCLIYGNSNIIYSAVLPIGGNHFTYDLAIGLRITLSDAERIKQKYGLAENDSGEKIEVTSVNNRDTHSVTRIEIDHILRPRAAELFSIIYHEIENAHLESGLTTGFVLTGGGSLLHGIKEVAQSVFAVPIRIGIPWKMDADLHLKNPKYATGYGLLVHFITHAKSKKNRMGWHPSLIMSRMKSWVIDFW